MQALHFGAGKIGLGFIGRILSESGFNVIFSDINYDIINVINLHNSYTVTIVNKKQNIIQKINNVSAIHADNFKTIELISQSNFITTAVGVNILDKIAQMIIKGILFKIQNSSITFMNIVACENKINASTYLKKIVYKNILSKHHAYIDKYIGFVDCTIDTIIPSLSRHTPDTLCLTAESFQEWILNVSQFKGKIPNIKYMKLSQNLKPFIERKLFTLNTGHAIAAYLGLLKKYTTINEAVSDKNIHNIVQNSMYESGLVLMKRFNFNKKDHFSYIKKIFVRFQNPLLLDYLERIARNPLQKLKKKERLIAPFTRAIQYKLPFSNLSKGIAAALCYKNKNDLESLKMASLIEKDGIKNALKKISSIDFNTTAMNSILLDYYTLRQEK